MMLNYTVGWQTQFLMATHWETEAISFPELNLTTDCYCILAMWNKILGVACLFHSILTFGSPSSIY